jgi:hypothetical protein
MIKTVMPGDYGWEEPRAVLVEQSRNRPDAGWMRKRAAAPVFRYSDVKVEPGHSLVHLIALGDSEAYDQNRNGDLFYGRPREVEFPEPRGEKRAKIECGNVTQLWTWTKHAKVYRDHRNKAGDPSYGSVKMAAHNDDMSRVELLVDIPNDDPAWRDDVEKLASGGDLPFSMSCRIPYDYCSICGNRSPARATYCDHLKNNMTALTKSGHRVGMINDHMVFFDISRVRVPADRIAYSLMKVAGFDGGLDSERALHVFLPPPQVSGGLFGLSKISADETIRKLADIEKRIEAVGTAPNESLAIPMPTEGRLPDDLVDELSSGRRDIGPALRALGDAKIVVSLRDFVRLVLGDRAGAASGSVERAEAALPGLFSRLAAEQDAELPEDVACDCRTVLPGRILRRIDELRPGMSLDESPVVGRMTVMVIRGSRPPELRKSAAAPDDAVADRMLRAYAAYKAAWAARAGCDSDAVRLSVLQHYVRH